MQQSRTGKLKIILLVSQGHSGSTLISLIMDSHSQIFSTGELPQYYRCVRGNDYCNCGKLLKNCHFWNKVFRGMNYKGLMISRSIFDFLFNKGKFYSNNKRIDLNKYIDASEKIYRNIAKCSRKNIIFDSSKDPDRAEVLFKSKKLDVVLVHLVRDGKAVTWSWHRIYSGYFRHMKAWLKRNIKIELIKKRNKNISNIFIEYENFVKNPQKEIKKILKKVNLDFEPNMFEFGKKIHHQVGGNWGLRPKKKNQKIYLDEEWKTKMPIFHRLIFNIFFGWLNIFYKIR